MPDRKLARAVALATPRKKSAAQNLDLVQWLSIHPGYYDSLETIKQRDPLPIRRLSVLECIREQSLEHLRPEKPDRALTPHPQPPEPPRYPVSNGALVQVSV